MYTQSLKLVQLNAENLFIFLDKLKDQNLHNLTEREWQALSIATVRNKPLIKTKALAKAVKEMNPDFLMVNEVGGLESLNNFNKYFLDNEYTPYLKEGNSNRGIDVGYLVKKNLPFNYLLISHRNRPIQFLYEHEKESTPKRSHFFSRDVAELRVFASGGHSPLAVFLLTHLKSKLDPEGIDFEGRQRRAAELRTLVDIYLEVDRELGGKTPILVCGDLNGLAAGPQIDPEFDDLNQRTQLKDALELAGLDPLQRTTQYQFPSRGYRRELQLDYIFLSPHLHAQLSRARVYRYKNTLEEEIPPPQSVDQIALLPSDHFPVEVELKDLTSCP